MRTMVLDQPSTDDELDKHFASNHGDDCIASELEPATQRSLQKLTEDIVDRIFKLATSATEGLTDPAAIKEKVREAMNDALKPEDMLKNPLYKPCLRAVREDLVKVEPATKNPLFLALLCGQLVSHCVEGEIARRLTVMLLDAAQKTSGALN